MVELWIEVERVDGVCTGPVPMGIGTGFLVRNGRLHFAPGKPICMFALQSVLTLVAAKERVLDDDPNADWIASVHGVQCPDPKGRTQWRLEQRPLGTTNLDTSGTDAELPRAKPGDLRVIVDRIEGRCSEGMCIGDRALVRGSSLYLAQPFCFYALQAVLPLLAGIQRAHEPNDWMLHETEVVCPDPLGNVILRIESVSDPRTGPQRSSSAPCLS